MNFFSFWAFFGGITVIASYYLSTLNSELFTYNHFLPIFLIWMILGLCAVYDIVNDANVLLDETGDKDGN